MNILISYGWLVNHSLIYNPTLATVNSHSLTDNPLLLSCSENRRTLQNVYLCVLFHSSLTFFTLDSFPSFFSEISQFFSFFLLSFFLIFVSFFLIFLSFFLIFLSFFLFSFFFLSFSRLILLTFSLPNESM